jgi:hypothetical protein
MGLSPCEFPQFVEDVVADFSVVPQLYIFSFEACCDTVAEQRVIPSLKELPD